MEERGKERGNQEVYSLEFLNPNFIFGVLASWGLLGLGTDCSFQVSWFLQTGACLPWGANQLDPSATSLTCSLYQDSTTQGLVLKRVSACAESHRALVGVSVAVMKHCG